MKSTQYLYSLKVLMLATIGISLLSLVTLLPRISVDPISHRISEDGGKALEIWHLVAMFSALASVASWIIYRRNPSNLKYFLQVQNILLPCFFIGLLSCVLSFLFIEDSGGLLSGIAMAGIVLGCLLGAATWAWHQKRVSRQLLGLISESREATITFDQIRLSLFGSSDEISQQARYAWIIGAVPIVAIGAGALGYRLYAGYLAVAFLGFSIGFLMIGSLARFRAQKVILAGRDVKITI